MTDPDDGAAPEVRWDQATVPASPRREPSSPGPAGGGSPFDRPRGERFVERGELGRGGMGRVIEATDTTLDRAVAIKQMLSTELVDQIRFEREVRITARLQHPGIVPILDAGRDPAGKPFYVMRKIEGRPLAERVTEATTAGDRLALVPNVLAAVDAVAYAHARGVIHRDIKPWNVLIGPFGETLVIDWGLARELDAPDDDGAGARPVAPRSTASDDALTRVGDAYGTPGFMAPEQARGEPSDRGADVYALGATLYHVLAGTSPFAGGSATEAIDRAAAGDRPDWTRIPSEVPPELIAIVTKAMAPAQPDRYADAGELATDLRRFLAGQLVAAHRYSVGERIGRFVRRHRIAVAIGAIAVTAIVVTSVLAVRRVVHERDTATAARADARDRADQLLIGRARALLATDPTASLALLKNLDPGSPRWAEARAIASAAAAGWIERGVAIHDGRVTVVELAPDGEHVVSTGTDGRVVITELETLRFRELARLDSIYGATWIEGGRAIACMTHKAIIRVDATTGAHVTLIERPSLSWLAAPEHADRIVFAGRTTVEQIATTPGAPPVVLTTAGTFAAGSHGLVVGDTTSVRWLDPAGVSTVIGPPLGHPSELFLLTDGPDARFAVLLDTTAIELELVDGAPVERGRWQVPPASQLVYLGRYLYAHTDGYRIALGERTTRLEGTPVPVGQLVTTSAGTVVADPLGTGRIWVTDTTATRELHHHPMMLTALAGARAARWLVAGTSNGELRIWAIRAAPSHRVTTPTGFPLLEVQGGTLYLGAGDGVIAFDIATGAQRVLPTPTPPQLAMSMCIAGDAIAMREIPGTDLVVIVPGHKDLRFPRAACLDAGETTWLTWTDGDDQWLAPLRDPDRKRRVLTTRDEVIAASITTRWMLTLHASGVASRIDLDTGAVVATTVADARAMALDATGAGWFAVGDGTHLVRWDGAATTTSTTSGVITVLRQRSRGGVLALSADGVVRVVAANGATERVVGRPGTLPKIDFAGTVAVYRDDDHVVRVDLDTGTPMIYRPGNMPAEVRLDPSGRRIAVQLLQQHPVVEVWDDPLPTELGALRRWVEASTNATMAVGSEIVTWVPPT